MKIYIVIPARLASSRLPNKVILPLAGKPMVQWVFEAARKVDGVAQVLVATDNQEVFDLVTHFGGNAIMTSSHHLSGTDRIGEVAGLVKEADVFINIQGDEPMISPDTIQQMVDFYKGGGRGIVTLYTSISDDRQLFDFNVVKLTKTTDDQILYFSRNAIPAQRDYPYKDWLKHATYYRHIGMYGFDRKSLEQICLLPQSKLEKAEVLEQLRWLENGFHIKGIQSDHHGVGVDTAEDLLKAEQKLMEKER